MDSGSAAQFLVDAQAYDRHVGRYGRELAARLCDVAAVAAGQRALDVGCGPGALTAVLVERVGPGGSVAAVDPSPRFVEACRARVPGADVRLGRAESLPLPDADVDVVLSQLVVNFMADAQAGVREMRRVVRPGGRVASVVWDYAGEMTLLRTFWDAAAAVDPARGAVLDEGRVMRHCGEGELGPLWRQAGLREVETGALVVRARYASFEDLWMPFAAGVGPSGAYFVSLPEPAREALLDEWHRRLGSPAAGFELSARAWYVLGRAS
jgi:SAM-dependent methyltransferase